MYPTKQDKYYKMIGIFKLKMRRKNNKQNYELTLRAITTQK